MNYSLGQFNHWLTHFYYMNAENVPETNHGKIWREYDPKVIYNDSNFPTYYHFDLEDFPEGSEDKKLIDGVQLHLANIITINQQLNDLDPLNLYFKQYYFCFEVTHGLVKYFVKHAGLASLALNNPLTVPKPQVVLAFESEAMRLTDLAANNHACKDTVITLLDEMVMFRTMLQGLEKLHSLYHHCDIDIAHYFVEVLSPARKQIMRDRSIAPVSSLNEQEYIVKLEKFSHVVPKGDKCESATVAVTPPEAAHEIRDGSERYDVYGFGLLMLEYQFQSTMSQSIYDIFMHLTLFQDDDKDYIQVMHLSLLENLLFNVVKKHLLDKKNTEIRDEILQYLVTRKEITVEQRDIAEANKNDFDRLMTQHSPRLLSLITRRGLVFVLRTLILNIRLARHKKQQDLIMESLKKIKKASVDMKLREDLIFYIRKEIVRLRSLEFELDYLGDYFDWMEKSMSFYASERPTVRKMTNQLIKLTMKFKSEIHATSEKAEVLDIEGFKTLNFKSVDSLLSSF